MNASRVVRSAPIVVVSGDARDSRIVTALQVGADAYAVKPVTMDLLAARIAVQLPTATRCASPSAGYADGSGPGRSDPRS